VTERSASHIAERDGGHPFLQRSVSFIAIVDAAQRGREGADGCRKLEVDKEKIEAGVAGTTVRISLALVQSAWYSESDSAEI